MKKETRELAKESRALEGIEGAVPLAGEKVAEAARLREQARQLQEWAQLEDLTVREEPLEYQQEGREEGILALGGELLRRVPDE